MSAATTEHVREAVEMEWIGFEARHPKLAGVVSREALVERLAEHLSDDPEYLRALAEARAAGMTDATVAQMLRSFVRDWLAGMFF